MKLLVVLIVLVCLVLVLWYFRDEISGEKLRFGYREEAGARVKLPKWPESARDGNPTQGHLVLKHKKHDTRIVYLSWQYAKAPANRTERVAAAKEFARVLREMTGANVSVKPIEATVKIGEQPARVYALECDKKDVGPGELYLWYFAPNKQRFFLIILDDDAFEKKAITHEFLETFEAGRSTVEHAVANRGKLAFDEPFGWRVFGKDPGQVCYVSPQEEVLLQINHGTRTNHARITKQYAAALTDSMLEAIGGSWISRDYAVIKDTRLGVGVVRVRGIAQIEHADHAYEVRLWISPATKLLYTVALSAEDTRTLDKFTTVFDKIAPVADSMMSGQ